MRVNNQEENSFYAMQGYTGTIQDKEAAYFNAGGLSTLMTAAENSRAQKIRALTDTTGAYTWVYPVPYPTGVLPAIQLTVEDATPGNVWNHKVVSVTETQVKVQVSKTNSVTVLGISVLGIAANPQAYVHINVAYPSA